MSSPEEASQGSCCGGSERAWIDPLEACSLSSDQLSERSEWIRHEIAPQVLGRRRLKDGLALEVVASPGMSERVDEWLEMERDCCGSIDWARRPSETAGQIRIEIPGVDPEGPLFAALPFLEPGEVPDVSRTGALSRVFKAGGCRIVSQLPGLLRVALCLGEPFGGKRSGGVSRLARRSIVDRLGDGPWRRRSVVLDETAGKNQECVTRPLSGLQSGLRRRRGGGENVSPRGLCVLCFRGRVALEFVSEFVRRFVAILVLRRTV